MTLSQFYTSFHKIRQFKLRIKIHRQSYSDSSSIQLPIFSSICLVRPAHVTSSFECVVCDTVVLGS